MPETFIDTVWADGTRLACYSPSLVVEEYFTAGATYPVAEFVDRARTALQIGSDRVREKFGFGCGHATATIAEIEALAGHQRPGSAVLVEGFAHTDAARGQSATP
jgi:uncharacterized repeat protein (TIGR04042 family)